MSDGKTQSQVLEGIESKLDMLIGAVAVQGKESEEQLKILTSLHLSSAQIATLTGLTPGYIRAWQSRRRRQWAKP